jgi:hypothetical protein
MKNRLSRHFRPPCRCRLIRRRLRKLAAECNTIETIASCVEFVVPSAEGYANGKREVRLWVNCKSDTARVGDDLRLFAIQQLRGMSQELAGAADRLEGGVA